MQAAVDSRLHRAQRFNSSGDASASGHCLVPHTLHLRAHFATAIAAYATTRTVAEILWTVHGARHPRGAQNALTAHSAIKQESLDRAFGCCNRPFQPRVPNPFPQWMQAADCGFEAAVEGAESAGMAHRPAAHDVHQAPEGSAGSLGSVGGGGCAAGGAEAAAVDSAAGEAVAASPFALIRLSRSSSV